MKKVLVLILVLFVASCANKKQIQCFYPDNKEEKAPNWICNSKEKGIVALESTRFQIEYINFMRQYIASKAKNDLLLVVYKHLQDSVKKAGDANGIEDEEDLKSIYNLIANQISDKSLKEVRIIEEATSSNKYLYVLLGYDKKSYVSYMTKILEESYKQDKNTWDKLVPENKRNKFEKVILKI